MLKKLIKIPRRHFCNALSNERKNSKAVLYNVSSPNQCNPGPELLISSRLWNFADICIRRRLETFTSRRPGFPRICSVGQRLQRGFGRSSFETMFWCFVCRRKKYL
ncbi:hypothetical protein CDAR_280061 [Caerostris darwini]|uniref:Uncharacterized protein n=1 Tax=Caerostris darwini TaxID=1538125 RepID=A0AAV4SAD0_9ARAC|nr:hypothetical protein CDAR_280061 [Caerostris darwini]